MPDNPERRDRPRKPDSRGRGGRPSDGRKPTDHGRNGRSSDDRDRTPRKRTGAGGRGREDRAGRPVRPQAPRMPKKWGSVARRGGRVVAGEEWRGPPEGEERPAGPRERSPEPPKKAPARAPAARDSAKPSKPSEPSRARARLPADVVREVQRVGGRRGQALTERLAQATEAYARDRYKEARSILRPLAHELPAVASVRELYGLVLYRMGSWKAALKELLEAASIGGSVDQHPVIADCYRALGRRRKVEQTWDELRRGGASAEVMAEGRLVMAGDLADQGKLDEAIALLEAAAGRELRHPRLDHLRQWYALGDLYERSGDIPRARIFFLRVAGHDPEYADIEHRLRSLR